MKTHGNQQFVQTGKQGGQGGGTENFPPTPMVEHSTKFTCSHYKGNNNQSIKSINSVCIGYVSATFPICFPFHPVNIFCFFSIRR